jgi:hypothetical protein
MVITGQCAYRIHIKEEQPSTGVFPGIYKMQKRYFFKKKQLDFLSLQWIV